MRSGWERLATCLLIAAVAATPGVAGAAETAVAGAEAEAVDPLLLAGFLIALLCFGAAMGVVAGLVGPGAGALLASGLYFLFGALDVAEGSRMAVAIGTALGVAAPLSVWSLARQSRAGVVDRAAAVRLGPMAAIGAGAAAAAALVAPPWALIAACGAGAAALGLQIAFWPQKGGRGAVLGPTAPLVGLGVGFAAGMSGQGGGGFGTAALSWLGAPLHTAAATAAALGAALTGTGAAVLAIGGALFPPAGATPPFTLGYVNLAAIVLIAPVWAMTAPFGAGLARYAPVMVVRLAFAILLASIGVTLLRAAGLT